MTGVYRLVCAWCQRELRAGDPKLPTSHSICPDCALKLEQLS
jgi:hypothetical protein